MDCVCWSMPIDLFILFRHKKLNKSDIQYFLSKYQYYHLLLIMSTDTKRFTHKDNALMTNSLLQMIPVVLLSAYFMFSTGNDFIWIASASSFCSSLVVMLMAEGSYETDFEHYGLYSGVSKMYDNLALSSCVTLLIAVGLYFRDTWLLFPDRMYPAISILCLIVSYFVRFMIRDKGGNK